MKHLIYKLFASAALLLPAWSAHAEVPVMPELPFYIPYDGTSGYQEIALPDGAWYLSFEGTRDEKIDKVEAGWATRAAELCQGAGRQYFLEKKYVGERVLKNEPLKLSQQSLMSGLRPAAGVIYIPIYTGPRVIKPLLTPSKMAVVSCLDDREQLIDTSRAVSVEKTLTQAGAQGFIGRSTKK